MPDAIPPDKPVRCVEAIKKVYAVSDALYDVTSAELIGEERAAVLALLTEARDLAVMCGCDNLIDATDDLRIAVAKKEPLDTIRRLRWCNESGLKKCLLL